MKREIKNSGEYVECDAKDIITRLDELKKAQVIVITSARIELAGADKDRFVKAVLSENVACQVVHDYDKMDDYQKSDIIFRNLVIG